MNTRRLKDLQENIELLHEQIAGKERARIKAAEEEKVRIGQQIKDLRQEVAQFQREKWQILANGSESLDIAEQEAEVAIVEIVEKVQKIEQTPSNTYPEEMLRLLREIRERLNQPGTPAAAKLKGTISSIPPFFGISYEAELDTENFFATHFPTFTRLIRGAAPKK